MIRAFVTVMLVLGVATNVAADHLQRPAERLAQTFGCKAEIVTDDELSVLGSYYDPLRDRLVVGTGADGVPNDVFIIIALHEIGHCLQDQEGRLWGRRLIDIELEADMLSAEMACQAGLDGRRMLHDAFVWAYETFGYEGDPNHGTLVERIRQGYYAPSCTAQKSPRREAPFA